MVSMTSIGGMPGLYWNTNVKTTRPMPLMTARPMPPWRTPTSRQAKRTRNPNNISIENSFNSISF
jgi:hypothetical protein